MDLVSPQPFWPLKHGLLSVYPSLRSDLSCDVVVLGGGITGALAAERLSRDGLNVIVLDKRDVGAGSTSASTALLQYEVDTTLTELTELYGQSDAERAYRLCYEAIDEMETLVNSLGVPEVFQRRKSVYLTSRKSDVSLLKREYAARRAMGLTVEYWEQEEIEKYFSFSRDAALVSSQAAALDCYRLAHSLLERSVAHGARVFDQTTVSQCEPGATGVRLTTDRGCTIQAGHVVFATGYESQDYLPHHIVTLKSTYALASEPLGAFPGWWEECLIWETARPYLYLRTTNDRRVMLGGEDDDFRNPLRRDALVEKKTARLEKTFARMFPQIELEVAYRWAGTFGETKDGLAYIGSTRQMPRCLFALGFGGNGIVYSLIAAGLISDAIHGRPNENAHLFRFDR